jgi:membrane protease YdiL (CAAX protease family)
MLMDEVSQRSPGMLTSAAATRTASLIRRHPLIAYFLLAFGISWGGIAFVAGPFALSGGPLMVTLLLAIAAGPTTASLVLTGIVNGRAGYRDLLARTTRWRVAPRWYAAALLINPAAILVVLAALSLASPVFIPGILSSESPLAQSLGLTAASPAVIVGIAIVAGLVAGLFEEIGWTGFATPHLLARHACLTAGLMLGVLWATWHIGGDVPGTAGAWGDQWPWRFLTWMYVGMVPYRVLMTWVYSHTRSVFLAVLMHTAYTSGQALLQPGAAGHAESALWWGLLGLALWIVVGLVALTDSAHLLRPAPLQHVKSAAAA